MITNSTWMYAGGLAAIGLVSRIWVRLKMDRKARTEDALPLFDNAEMEAATEPTLGDDVDVLAELRNTLAVLNRRRFAPEFWTLDEQLVKYYQGLPLDCQPTLRRATVRLIQTRDRWLQTVGTKTARTLGFTEACAHIEDLLRRLPPSNDAADDRFQQTLREAVARLAST